MRLALFCLCTAAVFVPLSHAEAESPYRSSVRTLARQAKAEAKKPEGIVPLLLLRQLDSRVPRGVLRRELETLAGDRSIPPLRRDLITWLLARELIHEGELERSRQLVDALGLIRDFRFIGPLDNEGKAGLDAVTEAELLIAGDVSEGLRAQGKERPVELRRTPKSGILGYVDLDALMRPNVSVCAILATGIESDREQEAQLFLGAGGAYRVFLNGAEIAREDAYRGPFFDRDHYPLALRKGANRLAIKLCADRGSMGLYARVRAQNGGKLNGVKISADSLPLVEPEETSALSESRSDFRALLAAATSDRAKPIDLYRYARYAHMSAGDDPAEALVQQYAKRAANEEPTLDHLEFAAALATQRGQAMHFVAKARELYPNHARAMLLEARLAASGVHPASALPILDRIQEAKGTVAISARALRAEVYDQLGLVEKALALRRENAERMERAPSSLRALLTSLGYTDREAEAEKVQAELVAAKFDEISARKGLIARALFRGERERVEEGIRAISAISGARTSEALYIAAVLEALGEEEAALQTLEAARGLAPDEPAIYRAEGKLLQRLDRDEEAKERYRAALALRPQDAGLRELLGQIEQIERPDEAYAQTAEALLERRVEASGYPTTILQDLTVQTVYENGLGSTFHQLAVQIHNEEGARSFRAYPIVYTPGSQRVELRTARVFRKNGQILEALRTYSQQMGEPWYRLYYDTRQLTVVFPELEPGDTVEIRYRVDDIAPRNMFDDYFGRMSFLKAQVPIAELEHVFILPEKRTFIFNQPELTGLERSEEVRGDERIIRYRARDIPALRAEARMPGGTEILPYLHVSTYASWEAVGRFYWGLIKDQLYADEALRATVRELVEDAPDLETKVRRIHAWVLDHTRYVGLEFGIHGYKPYRVVDIVKRGFGDCKDKAALLYAMFREAGIDADIVLIRTRRNGAIEDAPASLAVFDHAIAYVRELDLYLDGTAEHSGLRELPSEDQGTLVLHVAENRVEQRVTPVDPPERNVTARMTELDLAKDGSAAYRVVERIKGIDAASLRSQYQAEGTRKERLERRAQSHFTGASVASFEVSDVFDRNAPVELRYEGEAPQVASAAGEELRMRPSSISNLGRIFAPSPRREHPLDLGIPSIYEERIRVRIPEDARVVGLPESARAKSEFGEFRLDAREAEGAVEIELFLRFDRDRVEPSDYPAFRAWIEAIDQSVQQQITFGGAR